MEIQIWTAMITMLLFSWLKHIARYKWALANLAFLALAQHIYQNRPIQVAERAPLHPLPRMKIRFEGFGYALILQSRMTQQVISCKKII